MGEEKPLWQLVDKEGRLMLPPGGLQDLAYYQSTIMMGGAWRAELGLPSPSAAKPKKKPAKKPAKKG